MLKLKLVKALPLLLGLALLGPFLFGPKAHAANPSTMNFQGKVVNHDGTNVTDGTYSFIFRIYNTSAPTMTTSCTSTATCLWQETQASVQVSSGVFQVELGSTCALTSSSCNNSTGGPINFANNSSLYLTMQFSGDTSGSNGGYMSPLIHITSVPFALQADNSSTLGGIAASGFIQNQTASLQQANIRIQSATSGSIAEQVSGASGQSVDIFDIFANGVGTALLGVNSTGLISLQPAASLTSGQTALSQTLTNASSTGGTVNGYSQTITVNNTSSASTTNGINISLTDNASGLSNTNRGINISLGGSNNSQDQRGVNSSVSSGFGVVGTSSGDSAFSSCAGAAATGVCGVSSSTSATAGGVGVAGSSAGASSSISNAKGAGLYGVNTNSVTSGNFVTGTKGITTGSGTAGTAIGVYGQGNQGAGATIYGGYFALGTGGATAGSALYATNSTVAANILQLQDNTTDVMTVRDGGLVGIQNTFSAMTVPSSLAGTASAGGSLTSSSTYKYYVAAIDSLGGETTKSNELSCNDSFANCVSGAAGGQTINLTWTAVTDASGYKVYRTTAGGASDSELYCTTVLTNSYVDSGTVSSCAGALPSANTAVTSTNNSSSLGQITVGGLGKPTGQVYVSGTLPKDVSNGGVATGSLPEGVYVQGRYAYIVTFSNSKLQILNISNPARPQDVTNGGVSTDTGPQAVYVQGRYAYIVEGSGGTDKLQVFDVSNPASPVDISNGGVTTGSLANAVAIYVQGRYAYIADNNTDKLQIFDISNPSKPVDISSGGYTTISTPTAVFVAGRYAYITAGSNLQIFDISNPSSSGSVGTVSTSGNATAVYIQGRYAYITDNVNNDLRVFDVSKPSAPVQVGLVSTGNAAQSVVVQGRYAYVLNKTDATIQTFDVSNPASPVSQGATGTAGQPYSIFISGRYAYVVDRTGAKFQVFDLGGEYAQQLEAGGAEFGTLSVDSNSSFAGDAAITGGLTLGSSLQAAGSIATSGNLYVQGVTQFAGGILGGTTINNLSTPGTPTITTTGTTGAQTWKYRIVAVSAAGGTTAAGAEGSTTSANGVSTLTTSNYQQVSWSAVSGAVSYKVYRTAVAVTSPNPATTGLIATVTGTQLNDTGLAGDSSNFPTTDSTGNFTVDGLVTLQPAVSLIANQNGLTQTLTNGDSSGGTVNGYSQTITVNNTSSASTTNGINISLTDNTALGNTNNGIKIVLAGSNANQAQYGVDATANKGIGVRGASTGQTASNVTCGNQTASYSIGVCGSSSSSSSSFGVFGLNSASLTGDALTAADDAGVVGLQSTAGTAGSIYVGTKGITIQNTAAAYTSAGVVGQADGGAGATIYGGYFKLGTSGATLGAALYASNSTVAANILQLQNNNVNALVVDSSGTVQLGQANTGGANGVITFNNSTGTGTASITLAGNPTTNYTYQLPTGTVSSNQCLQSGTVSGGNVPLTFASCSAGGGDNGFVNSVAVTDFNLQDVAASTSVTGTTWTASGSNPTNVTLAISDASATTKGAVTTGTQTLAGVKTFQDFVILQPAASMTAGQTALTQTLTNASSTGGTVNGYNQTVTVSDTGLASTTNGINVAITDATTLTNTTTGVKSTLTDNGASGAKTNKAVAGTAGGSNSSAINYGGYFSLGGGAATSSAIYASNGSVAANIFQLQDSTNDVMVVGDGGVTTFTPQVSSATAFLVKNSSGNKILAVDNSASTAHLKVYDSSATQAYADIYYDDGTSTAVFAASSGTTALGSGNGPISIAAGTGGSVTITGDAASGFTTTTGALTLTGAAASTWSTSAGLLTIQGGGGLSLLAASSNTVTVDSGTTGSVVLGATNTTNAKAVSVGNANSGSSLTLEGGTGGSAIQIGNGATAHGVKIATDPTTVQTVTIGSTNTSSATTIQGGTNDITLNSGDGILLKSTTTSAVALNVASSSGSSVFNIDTTKANANNKVSNASFESALSGWSALNAGAASQSSAQAYEGVDSMLIATGTNGSGGGASYNTGGGGFLVSGTTYTLSAYVKTDSNLPVTTFEMGHADNGTTPTLVSCLTAQSLPVNGGWQRFTCTWTSGTITGSPFIYFKQSDAVNRNLYIDDVLLQTDANSDTNNRNAAINFTGAIVNGSVVLQNAANSTNALQVENASGNTIFNVDTTDTNLISNPGLEINGTGWSAIGTGTTIVRDSSNSYLGAYSLKVTTGTAADSGAQFTLNPTVTAISTNYTVSFFARRASGDATAFTDLIARYSADGTTTAGHFSDCSVTAMNSQTVLNTGWTRYFCTVNTTTTTINTSAYILIKDTAGAAHTWYIDGVQLEAASTASAYGAGAINLNGVITSPVVFRSAAATTAFQIQNSSNLSLFGADSLNNLIQIGSSVSHASNPVVLVLDNYNNATDPSGGQQTNGAMYYNVSTSTFRCYQGGAWRNCLGGGPSNQSTATQAPAAGTDTYLTGSQIPLPAGGFRGPTGSGQDGSKITWRVVMSKTAAGLTASTFNIRIGTNGTTTDTLRCSAFSTGTATAAIDWAVVTITVTATAGGSGTTLNCSATLTHWDNTGGFTPSGTAGVQAFSTQASFDSTPAGTKIGLSFNGSSTSTITIQSVDVTTANL